MDNKLADVIQRCLDVSIKSPSVAPALLLPPPPLPLWFPYQKNVLYQNDYL